MNEEMDYVRRMWDSRNIYTELLSHLYSKEEVQLLTTAQVHPCVYGYDAKTHFNPKCEEHQAEIEALATLQAKLTKQPGIPITTSM